MPYDEVNDVTLEERMAIADSATRMLTTEALRAGIVGDMLCRLRSAAHTLRCQGEVDEAKLIDDCLRKAVGMEPTTKE